MTIVCSVCGAVAERPPARVRRAAEVFCSRSCRYSLEARQRRFLAKVTTGSDCWEWHGFTEKPQSRFSERGYGKFKVSGRDEVAHRASYELFVGPVPDGLKVLHRCDNPPCVRPSHLFVGTMSDNMLDASAKGRLKHRRGNRRLSDEQYAQMLRLRDTGLPQSAIAARLGIGQTGVSAALRRRPMKEVPPKQTD